MIWLKYVSDILMIWSRYTYHFPIIPIWFKYTHDILWIYISVWHASDMTPIWVKYGSDMVQIWSFDHTIWIISVWLGSDMYIVTISWVYQIHIWIISIYIQVCNMVEDLKYVYLNHILSYQNHIRTISEPYLQIWSWYGLDMLQIWSWYVWYAFARVRLQDMVQIWLDMPQIYSDMHIFADMVRIWSRYGQICISIGNPTFFHRKPHQIPSACT